MFSSYHQEVFLCSPRFERFGKRLRCRSPQAATHVHYTSDVKLFFAWAAKPPAPSPFTTWTPTSPTARIGPRRRHRQPPAGRPPLLLSFPRPRVGRSAAQPRPARTPRHPPGPAPAPRRAGQPTSRSCSPRSHSPRDRAMFLLMLRCGLRVCEVHRLSLDRPLPPTRSRRRPPHARGARQEQRRAHRLPLAPGRCCPEEWLAVRPAVHEPGPLSQPLLAAAWASAASRHRLARYCRRRQACASPATSCGIPLGATWSRPECRSPPSSGCWATGGCAPPRPTSTSPTARSRPNTMRPWPVSAAGSRREAERPMTPPVVVKPFAEWPAGNRRFYEDFCHWLQDGGYSGSTVYLYSRAARLALGWLESRPELGSPG